MADNKVFSDMNKKFSKVTVFVDAQADNFFYLLYTCCYYKVVTKEKLMISIILYGKNNGVT